jgi:hypothetical protein
MVQYQDIINKQDEIIKLIQKISTSNNVEEIKELGEELDMNIKALKALKVIRIVQKQEEVG